MGRSLIASSLVSIFSSLALFACSSGSETASSDSEVISLPVDPPAASCVEGIALRPLDFEEELSVIASAHAAYVRSGNTFGSGLTADPDRNPVTVIATGSGAFAGNFQYVSRADWQLCGGAITVLAHAHVDLGGGGLTDDEMRGCAADLGRPECATLAHYCEPGTIDVSDIVPRCELKAGVEIDVSVHGEASRPARN